MAEDRRTGGGRATPAATRVVLPVMVWLIFVAVLVGLVGGGVLQGEAERIGAGTSSSTLSTIVIE